MNPEIRHLPAGMRRAAHRLVPLARQAKARGHPDPLAAALLALDGVDGELLAAEQRWWADAHAALTPQLVEMVGEARAEQVAAAVGEAVDELYASEGEVLGGDLYGRLVDMGLLSAVEAAELDRRSLAHLGKAEMNPLTSVVRAVWEPLKAERIVDGDMPEAIRLHTSAD